MESANLEQEKDQLGMKIVVMMKNIQESVEKAKSSC